MNNLKQSISYIKTPDRSSDNVLFVRKSFGAISVARLTTAVRLLTCGLFCPDTNIMPLIMFFPLGNLADGCGQPCYRLLNDSFHDQRFFDPTAIDGRRAASFCVLRDASQPFSFPVRLIVSSTPISAPANHSSNVFSLNSSALFGSLSSALL